MSDQVKSWGDMIHRYFLSIFHYISFYIKRLGSLTSSTSGGGSSIVFNKRVNSDRNQSLTSDIQVKPSSEIPGPKCLPVFGTLFEFNKFGAKRVHELSLARHAEYGDIFREKIFSQELVFVANTDLLKEWMNQEGKYPESLKQEPGVVFEETCPYLKRGLFFRNGEDWYRNRKLGHNIMIKSASEFESDGLFDACEQFLEGYMKDLKESIRKSEDGLIHDTELRSYEIAVGSMVSVVYGGNAHKMHELTGGNYATLSRNAKEANYHHAKLLEFPSRVAKWLGTEAWKGYTSLLTYNLTTCNKFGQLSREEILKSPDQASMRTHGLLYKTIHLNAPLEDIDSLLTDFTVDSKDPFAGTVMFVTHVLGRCPEIQEKIFEEVSQVYPDNQPITYSKAKDLEYTEGFFKEVLRLYPVAAFSARVVLEDTVIAGYHIKPGTALMYSTFRAHRDPRYFKDPLKVLPERWLNSDNDSMCDPNAFAAFGLKARICLGQHLATAIFCMYIANVVRNFKLTTSELPQLEMKTVLYPVNQKPVHYEIR